MNNTLKKLMALVLSIAMVLSFTACGSGGTDAPDKPDPAPEVTATPEGGEEAEPDECVMLRQAMLGTTDMAAVAYLGWYEEYLDLYDFSQIQEFIADAAVVADHPFIADMDDEHFVPHIGGELYCIVPADADASITVYDHIFDENTYESTYGDVIYSADDGKPVIIMCNESEIFPNVMVEIIDSDGNMLEYYPCLSGMDGRLEVPYEEPTVLDFSNYEDVETEGGSGIGLLTLAESWTMYAYAEDGRFIEADVVFDGEGGVKLCYGYDKMYNYEVYYEGIISETEPNMYGSNLCALEMYKTEDYSVDGAAEEYVCLYVYFEQENEEDEYITMHRVGGTKLFGNEEGDEYEMYGSWG